MWTHQPIIGFDTETTGIDSFQDRLVTCSVVLVTSQGIRKRYWLADPGVEIPEKASAVHGITTEYAREHGRPITEVLEEIASTLASHMKASHPVVAFNAVYDFTLLDNELLRHDLPTLTNRLGGQIFPVVDPYLLDRYVDQFRKGKRKLEDMCRHYGVLEKDNFHNAEADVLATLRVLAAQVRKFPKVARTSLEEIQKQQILCHNNLMKYLAGQARKRGEKFNESRGWPVASLEY